MPFVKIDCGMLDSTVWIDLPLRNIFLTALLMAEPAVYDEPVKQIACNSLEFTGWSAPPGWYGFVPSSGIGIIRRADVESTIGFECLCKLGEPEQSSRSQQFEGRRMIRIDGGYLILNYQKYRDKDHTAAERMRRFRQRKKGEVTSNIVTATRNITQAEAEAEVEAEESKTPLPPLKAETNNHMGIEPSPSAQEQNHIIDLPIQDAQRATVELLGVSGYTALAAKDAVGTVKRRKPEMKNIEVPVFIMKLWREVSSQPKRAIPSLKTFLSEIGSYVDSDHWKAPQKPTFIPQIDWQGGHVGEDGVYVSKSGQRVPGFICPPKPTYSEIG